MIIGVHHVAMSVPDIEAAVAFYCDVLGFEIVTQGGWEKGYVEADKIIGLPDTVSKTAMIRGANTHIEMFEFTEPAGEKQDFDHPMNNHGLTHFCLQVTDIQMEYERLIEAGMRFHCEPQDLGTTKATYGRDPFGNVIELYEVFDPSVSQVPIKA
jgi:catechol 2,3-dioxygenase-like lactoylglutathione lyase family enzyme